MNPMISVPSNTTAPEEIEEKMKARLHQPPNPDTGEWLHKLVTEYGHLTTPEHRNWRLISLIWLAAEYDIETAWPYLIWFNMNEPTMGDHLDEMLSEAVDYLQCHVPLARWIANTEDERLITFFAGYKNLPAARKMPRVMKTLINEPQIGPGLGPWLESVCRHTVDNPSPYMRPWRLLAATWYATQFNAEEGLTYLRLLSENAPQLSAEDIALLTRTTDELGETRTVIRWIASADDPAVEHMLGEFGHPDLTALVDDILENEPDYSHLAGSKARAADAAATFRRLREMADQAGLDAKAALLDLGCGPLAPQTVLFASEGYRVTGADVTIPPAYLPPNSLMQRMFKRGKQVKAWEAVTAPYYQALAQETQVTLNWRNVEIDLVDLTRLSFADGTFNVVICADHLHYAPNVTGLLSEAARVLQAGGWLLLEIKPYPAYPVVFDAAQESSTQYNQLSAADYRALIEQHFTVEQWHVETDDSAVTDKHRAAYADYDGDDLAARRLLVLARK